MIFEDFFQSDLTLWPITQNDLKTVHLRLRWAKIEPNSLPDWCNFTTWYTTHLYIAVVGYILISGKSITFVCSVTGAVWCVQFWEFQWEVRSCVEGL